MAIANRPVVLTPEQRAELQALIDQHGIAEACRRKQASRGLLLGAVATGRMTRAAFALVFGGGSRESAVANSALSEVSRVGGRFA